MKKPLNPKRTGKDLTRTDDERMCALQKAGYTIQEIADAYEISKSNACSRINRVKKRDELKEKAKGTIYEFIDMGKLFALRRAGWSNKKISAEFHKSEEEIEQIIFAWQQDTGMEELCPEV